jgi:hypothetical protein
LSRVLGQAIDFCASAVDVVIGDLGERGESDAEDEKAGECPE